MVTHFTALFEHKRIDPPNPNLLIIDECFQDHEMHKYTPPLHNGEKFVTLTDFFSSENPLTYGTKRYDDFPPTIQFDYIIEHEVPNEQQGLYNYQEFMDYVEAHPPDQEVRKVQQEIIDSKAERRGLDKIPEKSRPAETDDSGFVSSD